MPLYEIDCFFTNENETKFCEVYYKCDSEFPPLCGIERLVKKDICKKWKCNIKKSANSCVKEHSSSTKTSAPTVYTSANFSVKEHTSSAKTSAPTVYTSANVTSAPLFSQVSGKNTVGTLNSPAPILSHIADGKDYICVDRSYVDSTISLGVLFGFVIICWIMKYVKSIFKKGSVEERKKKKEMVAAFINPNNQKIGRDSSKKNDEIGQEKRRSTVTKKQAKIYREQSLSQEIDKIENAEIDENLRFEEQSFSQDQLDHSEILEKISNLDHIIIEIGQAETKRQENEQIRSREEQKRQVSFLNEVLSINSALSKFEDTEKKREANELLRKVQEIERQETEKLRKQEEEIRMKNEKIREKTELDIKNEEEIRNTNENIRKNAEVLREKNEEMRKTNEIVRESSETVRRKEEENRGKHENNRKSAENRRVQQESDRKEHEDDREKSENQRQEDEHIRNSNEKRRMNREEGIMEEFNNLFTQKAEEFLSKIHNQEPVAADFDERNITKRKRTEESAQKVAKKSRDQSVMLNDSDFDDLNLEFADIMQKFKDKLNLSTNKESLIIQIFMKLSDEINNLV